MFVTSCTYFITLWGTTKRIPFFLVTIVYMTSKYLSNFRWIYQSIKYTIAVSISLDIYNGNKYTAQGQSLPVYGINWFNSCFSHGPLYNVACVGEPWQLFYYTQHGKRNKLFVSKCAIRACAAAARSQRYCVIKHVNQIAAVIDDICVYHLLLISWWDCLFKNNLSHK